MSEPTGRVVWIMMRVWPGGRQDLLEAFETKDEAIAVLGELVSEQKADGSGLRLVHVKLRATAKARGET